MQVDKAEALLQRFGRDTVSSQALEPGLAYWFADKDACVAYVVAGRSWVAAGGPICAPERRPEIMRCFVRAAKAAGMRPRFFAIEEEIEGFESVLIGLQPEWDPHAWAERLASKASLREQLRRARAKGVSVRGVGSLDIDDSGTSLSQQVRAMVRDWQQTRAMAPMRFLVNLDLFSSPERKHYFVAEQGQCVVALLVAVPIAARSGWFLENLLRAHDAPNGSTELLFDCAMKVAAHKSIEVVSFGLAPLSGEVSPWLAKIRDHTGWLYDFNGLRGYKAKFQPSAWRKIYLSYPSQERGLRATMDSLTAFAGGSWIGFGLRTLAHAHATLVWWFALLLIPWTVLLAQAGVGLWFPSDTLRAAWVIFDLLFFIGLVDLALDFEKHKANVLTFVATTDALLGLVQLWQYNQHQLETTWQWGIAVLTIAAPLGAAILLALSSHLRESLYRLDTSGDYGRKSG